MFLKSALLGLTPVRKSVRPPTLVVAIAPRYQYIAFALSIDDDYPNRLVQDVMSMAR